MLQIKKIKKWQHLVKETITLFFGKYPLVVKSPHGPDEDK